jgi:hypothetical protein
MQGCQTSSSFHSHLAKVQSASQLFLAYFSRAPYPIHYGHHIMNRSKCGLLQDVAQKYNSKNQFSDWLGLDSFPSLTSVFKNSTFALIADLPGYGASCYTRQLRHMRIYNACISIVGDLDISKSHRISSTLTTPHRCPSEPRTKVLLSKLPCLGASPRHIS